MQYGEPCSLLHSQPTTPCMNPEISSELPENWPRKHPNYGSRKNVWTSSGSEDGIRRSRIRKIPDYNRPKNPLTSSTRNVESGNEISTLNTPPKVCQHWLSGNCVKGDNCWFIHSWFCRIGISMLARLDPAQKGMLVVSDLFFRLRLFLTSVWLQ